MAELTPKQLKDRIKNLERLLKRTSNDFERSQRQADLTDCRRQLEQLSSQKAPAFSGHIRWRDEGVWDDDWTEVPGAVFDDNRLAFSF